MYAQFAEAGKGHSKAWQTHAPKEWNKYDLTAAPYFWLPNRNEIIMIGLGALLLVVSHLNAVPVLVLGVGLEMINN